MASYLSSSEPATMGSGILQAGSYGIMQTCMVYIPCKAAQGALVLAQSLSL